MDTLALTPPRTQRRQYSPAFKAHIVDTCKQPGASVAAIAQSHHINPNTLYRWLREARPSETSSPPISPSPTRPAPIPAAFVPVQLHSPLQDCIHLQLLKHDLTVRIDWPVAHAQSCLHTLQGLLR
jgi:transposase-like protein